MLQPPTATTSSGSLTPPPPSSRQLRFYRLVTLTSLLFTDGSYTLLRRYSRGILNETYSVNDVLLVAEVIKFGFSCYMILSFGSDGDGDDGDIDRVNDAPLASSKKGTRKPRFVTVHYLRNLLLHSKKMLLLAVMYGVGNILSYYALAQIGAGTFVVIANLKTLTTAGFSVCMLGRTYSSTKWRALVLLVVGVILFVLPTLEKKNGMGGDGEDNVDILTTHEENREEEEEEEEEEAAGDENRVDNDDDPIIEERLGYSILEKSEIVLGVALELIIVTLSGFACIYFEKAIKHDPFNIWERNFQLGFYSILIYAFLIISDNNDRPFSNWSAMACILSVLGAFGGLLVALSIKYGDSVLKTLAISGSIIYASIVDHIFLGGPLDQQMLLSAIIVVIAILNYNLDAS